VSVAWGDPVRVRPLHDPAESSRPLTLGHKAALAVEIVVTYVRARQLLARRGLPGAVARLRQGPSASQPDGDPGTYRNGLRLGAAVGKVLSPLPADSRCLTRSLVLTALLARRGIPSRLVIGVRGAPEFGGHAWVEYGGMPLLRDEESIFTRLVEFNADGSLSGNITDA
jgi:Transglutaminase-like superfamily